MGAGAGLSEVLQKGHRALMTAQAGLQTPPFPARHWDGVALRTAGVKPHFCCSPTLSAVYPASVPHALSRRTCGLTGRLSPIRGRGVLVCSFRLLTDDGAELQVTLTSHQCTLPSSPSLSASSFSFLTSLSARCSPKLPVHSPHPQTSALLGDHIRKQMWMCWTRS